MPIRDGNPYGTTPPNSQIYYYPGPPGPTGPSGLPGSLNNTATSFTYAQLAHVITQIIQYYPTTVLRSYATGFTFAGLEGTPVELYSSPDGTYGGLFVISESGDIGAMPLQSIVCITLGEGVAITRPLRIFQSRYSSRLRYQYRNCDTRLFTGFYPGHRLYGNRYRSYRDRLQKCIRDASCDRRCFGQ
jgi:hypothetical protein